MKKVKIITDSASGLDKKLSHKFGIEILYHPVIIGKKILKEGEGFSLKEYYQLLRESKELPKTSQVNPSDIDTAFKKFSSQYEKILFITILSTYVNTFDYGSLAKKSFPAGKIEVFDSQTGLGHQGLMAIEAAKLAAEGANLKEIIVALERIRERGGIWVVLESTKYLRMGGRIGYPAWVLTNVFSLKPVITLKNGRLGFAGFVRSNKSAADLIQKRILKHSRTIQSKKIKIFLHDADNHEAVEQVKANLKQNFEVLEEYWTPISAVVGTHLGPGTLAVCYNFV